MRKEPLCAAQGYMVDAKGTMPPAPTDASEQPTLRVMRLYKPRLDGRRVLPSCSVATATTINCSKVPRGDGDFALSSALKLPDSFGNIYLGETFTAYIRYVLPCLVCHGSLHYCYDVCYRDSFHSSLYAVPVSTFCIPGIC